MTAVISHSAGFSVMLWPGPASPSTAERNVSGPESQPPESSPPSRGSAGEPRRRRRTRVSSFLSFPLASRARRFFYRRDLRFSSSSSSTAPDRESGESLSERPPRIPRLSSRSSASVRSAFVAERNRARADDGEEKGTIETSTRLLAGAKTRAICLALQFDLARY